MPVVGATISRSLTPGRSTIIPCTAIVFQKVVAVSGRAVRRRFCCAWSLTMILPVGAASAGAADSDEVLVWFSFIQGSQKSREANATAVRSATSAKPTMDFGREDSFIHCLV